MPLHRVYPKAKSADLAVLQFISLTERRGTQYAVHDVDQ